MRIYSMTATFGKLEGASLTLKPGMNVIHAPNEWGKSTWCAFLMAMLYGVDTRSRGSRNALTDRMHYAPWSGSPMSGRIELNWNGRDITIERSTAGRIPMGNFRAYETDSGLEVPELNAANCGQMLLGVEADVFRRAGFIRLSDLPVTQNDDLRRRLNALVTTGDESGDGARLEKALKELKNDVRYNRSGRLPQARLERTELEASLARRKELQAGCEQIAAKLEENKAQQHRLENHLAALDYQDARRDAERVAASEAVCRTTQARCTQLEQQCAQLPDRETAESSLSQVRAHREQVAAFRSWQRSLPQPPRMPKTPRPFLGMEPEEAQIQVQEDAARSRALSGPVWWILLTAALLCFAGAVVLALLPQLIGAIASAAVGFVLLILSVWRRAAQGRGRAALARKYGSGDPNHWIALADEYAQAVEDYHRAEEAYAESQATAEARRDELKARHAAVCGDMGVDEAMDAWQQILQTWDALDDARQDVERANAQHESVKAMARPLPDTAAEDDLTLSREQTHRVLQRTREEQQLLQTRSGEYRIQLEQLGSEAELTAKLRQLDCRISALERTEAALELAQKTLKQASEELQRRFAPGISKRAEEILSRMTGGRYNRLTLAGDLTLHAGTETETTLREAQWRSEGTIDQLYLALRLSVAAELTPTAPIILDDALVRFDDTRLQAALNVLQDLSKEHQILLFTCQSREEQAMKG